MGLFQIKLYLVLLLFISLVASLSASTFISDAIFGGSPISSERRLLQAKKQCPMSFEFQNYTTLISKCKGPAYDPKLCCPAFKEFACPFVEYLNDLSNDCATTMFSYMNLRGHYPPGLFSSTCKEGPLGLECPAPPPGSSENTRSDGHKKACSLVLVVVSVLLCCSL